MTKLRVSDKVTGISSSILMRIGKELLSSIPDDFVWRQKKYNKVIVDALDNGAKYFVVYIFEIIADNETVILIEVKRVKG